MLISLILFRKDVMSYLDRHNESKDSTSQKLLDFNWTPLIELLNYTGYSISQVLLGVSLWFIGLSFRSKHQSSLERATRVRHKNSRGVRESFLVVNSETP